VSSLQKTALAARKSPERNIFSAQFSLGLSLHHNNEMSTSEFHAIVRIVKFISIHVTLPSHNA